MNAMEHSSGDMTEVCFSVSICHADEIIDKHFNDSDSAVVQCDSFSEMGAVHHFFLEDVFWQAVHFQECLDGVSCHLGGSAEKWW